MSGQTPLPPVLPLASMEEAWDERDHLQAEGTRLEIEHTRLRAESRLLLAQSNRLGAESIHLFAEGDRIVVRTAQALYGQEVQIDWQNKTILPPAEAMKRERP